MSARHWTCEETPWRARKPARPSQESACFAPKALRQVRLTSCAARQASSARPTSRVTTGLQRGPSRSSARAMGLQQRGFTERRDAFLESIVGNTDDTIAGVMHSTATSLGSKHVCDGRKNCPSTGSIGNATKSIALLGDYPADLELRNSNEWITHILSVSTPHAVSARMFTCWQQWITSMILSDPMHTYQLHTHMVVPPNSRVVSNVSTGRFGDAAWHFGVGLKVRMMRQLLRQRYEHDNTFVVGDQDIAIMTDLDVLPLMPYSALRHALDLHSYDFHPMHEPYKAYQRGMGAINSGFYVLRNNVRTRRLVDLWATQLESATRLPNYGDQNILVSLLRSLRSSPVVWKPISWPIVVRHRGGVDPNRTIAFHACCVQDKFAALAQMIASRYPGRTVACI